jgi:DNA-binding SARP family transcriptional activator
MAARWRYSPAMARCTVRLLGRFEVRVDDRPVPVDAWRNRRAADLVKVLALEPTQAMHREQVMALLWPDLAEEPAGANLRKAVHYARRAMGTDESIRSESGLLTLWDGRAEVDAALFLAAADAALASGDRDACAAAADLCTGQPLPADRYEPWATGPRQRMRERLLAVLKGAGRWRHVLDLDPTDEQAHRELMRAHLRAGERRDAMRQFERLRDALREHMAVAPAPETIALYEEVLAQEGEQPPEPAQRAAVLLATGLVHLNRQEFGAAERLARQALDIAVDAGLAHEVGDAGTLLGLVASWTGRWHEMFRQEFTASLRWPAELGTTTYDANLCFAEYHLAGATSGPDPATYARDLLALADDAGSVTGRGVAELMIGEAYLFTGEYAEARTWLRRAAGTNREAGAGSGLCISLERLAQTEVAAGDLAIAGDLLDQGRAIADTSPLRSHLLVRLLGVAVQAAPDVPAALRAVAGAEQILADARRVCEPCSINFRVQAATVSARAGDLHRARRHLSDAERIAGMWQGGPWTAAVWEARAALRAAEGDPTQADALLREAADGYTRAGRTPDADRCRAGAGFTPSRTRG